MISLKGRVVIITGASSGFGEHSARLFSREGCKVVVAARRLERLERMAEGDPARPYRCQPV
jgi:3-hydroxy acid dehydrogenase / malonic semialdehyde reductase